MAKLDLEEVDQEMAANEANHSAIETDALESVPANEAPEGAPADNARAEENVVGDAWVWSLEKKSILFAYLCRFLVDNKFFFFLIC